MDTERLPAGSWASSTGTRRSMRANKRRDTRPEWAVRSAVHRRGLRYRVDARPLADLNRTADLVFRRARVAVFVDGCFWHGCPTHYTKPVRNGRYWADKVARNRERDADTDRRLSSAGWSALRFWEHEDPDDIADRVERAVRARPPEAQRVE